ncbi:MAG: hypothetical protein DCC67_00940 [Planctomycetota bacterium]|nr:MAG: hypothetical protein DCC67_00940 [Planctomycetota bacterium]
MTVRDQHTTWRTVEHVDGQGDFWIARTTPAFRLTHAFFFYDTPSGDWMPGADYLGGNKWLSTHDISAYLSAPSLTIEASKPDGASPHARGATWQTFRYNGDIVRLSVKTAPEPAGFSMAAAAALILLHYRRRHVDGAARLA